MVDHSSRIEDVLHERLVGAGAKVQRRRKGRDLAIELGNRLYSIRLMRARDARIPVLRGFLAEGILEAQADSEVHLLPVIAAPSISDTVVQALQEFADKVAPHQAWGVVDARGRLGLYGPLSVSLPPLAERLPHVVRPRGPSLFSDVHQWLLKVLLAPHLPEGLVQAPRQERVSSARQLASLGGVSLGSAARFVRALDAAGHLERRQRQLVLVRRRELLESWRSAARPTSSPLGLSWAISPSQSEGALAGLFERLHGEGVKACLGLHAACDALGFSFVRGVKPLVYVDRLPDAVGALRLAGLSPSAGGRPPDLFLDSPQAPRSCFTAAVERGALQVTDVVQSWLDVFWHPARGREQAEILWEQILEPRLIATEPPR